MFLVLVEGATPVQASFDPQMCVRLNCLVRIHGIVDVTSFLEATLIRSARVVREKSFCCSCIVILESTLGRPVLIDSFYIPIESCLEWHGLAFFRLWGQEHFIIVFQNLLCHIMALALSVNFYPVNFCCQ